MAASFHSFISPTKCSHRHSRSDVRSGERPLARITALADHHPSDLTLITLNSDSSPQRGPRLVRSRSLDMSPDVTQITREMEDTLEASWSNSLPFATTSRDYTSLSKPFASKSDDIFDANYSAYDFSSHDEDNMFNLPPLPMALGYNEFGVPYPQEENICILGGNVRRMPTIESMGSGEITSRSSATSHRHEAGAGHRLSSRPPTRTTHLTLSTGYDSAGSNPPSRPSSLSSRAERLLRMSPISPTSEHGELLGRINPRLSTLSSGEFTSRSLFSATDDTTTSSESRGSVTTYHTAAMGSYSPSSIYHDGVPVEQDI